MNAIRGQKTVINPLPQAVRIDRVSEIAVCVPVVLAQRCGGHAHLIRALKVFQNLPPVALIPSAAPMTLVHDNQVEEIPRVLPVEAWASLVVGNSLIGGKVHLAALYGFTLNF